MTWNYPPPTSSNFEKTLQSKEDSEGCTCSLHHVHLMGGVATKLGICYTLHGCFVKCNYDCMI